MLSAKKVEPFQYDVKKNDWMPLSSQDYRKIAFSPMYSREKIG
jgi:hypothetical protein